MKALSLCAISFMLLIACILVTEEKRMRKAKIEAFCEGWRTGRSTINYTDSNMVFNMDSVGYSMKVLLYTDMIK
jgi:hypothetical protein